MSDAADYAVDPRLEAMLEGAMRDWPDTPPPPHFEVEEAVVGYGTLTVKALDPARVLLDVREAAARLGCSRSLLYELLAAGELAFIKIGRLTKIPQAALDDLIARRIEAARHRPRPSGAARRPSAAYPATGRAGRRGRRPRGER